MKTTTTKRGQYAAIGSEIVPVTGCKQAAKAQEMLRAAGLTSAPVSYWDGKTWTHNTGWELYAEGKPLG